jgi:transcriptional regulator with XRE-family HTH domain
MGPDLRRRMVAARMLAGLTSAEALAEKIDQRGLGTKVLRNYEQGKDAPEQRDLEAIADACEIPVEWFIADLSRLPEIAPTDSRAEIRRVLDQALERARLRRKSKPSDRPAQSGEAR